MSVSWQAFSTALIVGACAVHAAWQLMPVALRDRCRALLGWRAGAASGCGGCDHCGAPAATTTPGADGAQVVQIVRRSPGPRGG